MMESIARFTAFSEVESRADVASRVSVSDPNYPCETVLLTFVKEQNRRFSDQGSGDRYSLSLTPRQASFAD